MTLKDWALLLGMLAAFAAGSTSQARPTDATTGTATYCAPTPTHCQDWGGDAHLGAVRSFTYGDRAYRVRVCRTDVEACTEVSVVSHCDCGSTTVIDLSPAAFLDIAPSLEVGVIAVSVERVGPAMTLPPTDTP